MSTPISPAAPAPTTATSSVPDRVLSGLHRLPLRVRLISILLSLLLVALTLTSAATALLMRRELLDRVDDNLHKSAAMVATRALSQMLGDTAGGRLPSSYAVVFFPTGGAAPRVMPSTAVDAVPQIDELPLDDPRVLTGRPFTLGTDDSELTWRAVAGRHEDGSLTFVVAQPLADVSKTVGRLVAMTAGIGLVVILACAGLGWFAVRRAFRPLTQIEDAAAAIASGDLTRRAPASEAPAEVAALSTSFNAMAANVETSLAAREESQERMRQFVADASHELRTPLATVRGYAELYRQGAVPSDAVTQTMQRIETEAARMAHLVDDLLLLARLDEERPIEFLDVDLTVIAADAVQAARVRDPDRRITLQGLSGALAPQPFTGDQGGLHQVLDNLLTNAIRHTPAGTPIEVAVGLTADGTRAVVEVRDHGPGIDEAARARVFERFVREDKARSRANGGTGLGLAIVAAIVERHNGRVGIKPTYGGGATFVVELPAQPLTADSQE